MRDYTALGLLELAEALRTRAVSAGEVTEAYLARIEALNPVLGCYVTVASDSARVAARASDARRARGAASHLLDGVPLALKDNIDTADLVTTAGIAAYRNRVPDRDAFCVERLRGAGAVILGKLALHEAALGATTDNEAFGRCHNPHRHGFTPGGSSGGSGAAVAAGLCAGALGTDTMGSVRVPASYCGVVGFKPTRGVVSTRGVVPLSLRLDNVGVLGRSVRDVGVLLSGCAGFDPEWVDACTLDEAGAEVPNAAAIAGTRLGFVQLEGLVDMAPDVAAAGASAVELLRELGCTVEPVLLPDWRPAAARRAGLLVSEVEGALVHEEALSRDSEGFSAPLRALLDYGARCSAATLVRAERELDTVRLAMRKALTQADLLALPTTPQTAFAFGSAVPVNQAELTAPANFSGGPAVSVPAGFSTDGLPVGLQLIGRPGADARVLAVARAYERAAGWDMTPHGLASPSAQTD